MPGERTILDFLDRVLPGQFTGPTWEPWRAVLKATFGIPLSGTELRLFQAVTGRQEPPAEPASELWACVGRRGGKSQIAALIAVYLATCRTYPLAPGERGILPIVAADRRQARVVAGYVRGLLHSARVLEQLITRELRDSIELSNRVTIEIHTASYRTIRGYTIVSAVCDELAFWPVEDDAADQDKEILAALRPAMSTIPNALLVCASTPYARRGELHGAVERYFGQPGDVLVVKADTATMNPSVDPKVIARAFERDPVAALSEYGRDGEIAFRADVAALLSEDAIQAVTPEGTRELGPTDRRKARAHFDAATGSGSDSAALAVAFEGQPAELAAVRYWRPPFSPAAVIREASELCRRYHVSTITVDRYAPGLVAELFREHSITCKVAAHDTSAGFLELLSAINSKRVRLLDEPRLLAELRRLERRPGSGDRERVGHPPQGHDDVAAATAGALVGAFRRGKKTRATWGRSNSRRTVTVQRLSWDRNHKKTVTTEEVPL